MEYDEEIFNNYQELATKHPGVAAELLDKVGEGEWQESELYWYSNKENFAKHEVADGWYSDIELTTTDFKGAPDLLDFISFRALGNALVETWDDSYYFETKSGEIVAAKYGF